jgi:hypothetical protein
MVRPFPSIGTKIGSEGEILTHDGEPALQDRSSSRNDRLALNTGPTSPIAPCGANFNNPRPPRTAALSSRYSAGLPRKA